MSLSQLGTAKTSQMANGKGQMANCETFGFCHLPFAF
jgi:hypothetical protein